MRKIRALPLLGLALAVSLAAPAAATQARPTEVIVLPGATSAEPIAAAPDDTFYAADMFGGTIYRGNIRTGTAEVFIRTPPGAQSVGMDLDVRHGLLFVAGGNGGKAYVYDIHTRTLVATYTFGDPNVSDINDVTLTPYGAWFDDSTEPQLYFVPNVFGRLGPPRTLHLTGPAAGPPGTFTINDITSTPSGDTLLVAPTFIGKLMTIDPRTGSSRIVAGVDVPNADGVLLSGRDLWVTQIDNRITRWRLDGGLTSGTPVRTITNPLFHVPLTSVKFGDRLAVVNSHLDSGFPPTSPTYEVLVMHD